MPLQHDGLLVFQGRNCADRGDDAAEQSEHAERLGRIKPRQQRCGEQRQHLAGRDAGADQRGRAGPRAPTASHPPGHHGTQQAGEAGGERRQLERFGMAGPPGFPHAGAPRRIADQRGDGGAQGRRVTGRHQQPGDPVIDRCGDLADIRGNHRHAVRHRLQDRHRQPLLPRWQQQDVGLRQQPRRGARRDPAEEADAVGEAERRSRITPRREITVAGKLQPPVGTSQARGRKRFQQHIDALAWAERAEKQQAARAAR